MQRPPARQGDPPAAAAVRQQQDGQSWQATTAPDLRQSVGVFRHELDCAAELGGGGACQRPRPAALQPSTAPTGHWQRAAASGIAGRAQPQVSRPSADTGDGPSQLDNDTDMLPEPQQPPQQRTLLPAQPAVQGHMEDQLVQGAHLFVSHRGAQHQQPAAARSIMSYPPVTMDQQPGSLLRPHDAQQGPLDTTHRCDQPFS
jgi:hypothetical protein